jgi:hypothetical protein
MESVEFYNTPEGDVMYKQLSKPVQELTADSREVIEEMLDLSKLDTLKPSELCVTSIRRAN